MKTKVRKNKLRKEPISCKYCKQIHNSRSIGCMTCISRIRRYRNKTKAVNYLGGSCVRCGYNQHLAALEFHHIEDKDDSLGTMLNRKWETIKIELDKCILLCSNCHRIEHSKYHEMEDLISSGD
jgi:hypothetical protein